MFGEGSETQVAVGAVLEVFLVIANIATAVVFFPVLKGVNETVALGYVASRITESAIIVTGLMSLLTVTTLRDDFGDTLARTTSLDMALLGLVGGPLAFLGGLLVILGVFDNPSAPLFALTVVEILWEASLALYLTIRGYRPSPLLEGAA